MFAISVASTTLLIRLVALMRTCVGNKSMRGMQLVSKSMRGMRFVCADLTKDDVAACTVKAEARVAV